ncbi:MAG: hypothetical protein IPJ19_08505 [Planctomycetes bacterium]|nr:hypothetical protein [Planctomycetota bacterium]
MNPLAPALLILAGVALLPGAAPAPSTGGDKPGSDHARAAQEKLAARDYEGAARLLADDLRRGACDGATAELYARTLANLERPDEAAHWYEQAAELYAGAGQDSASKQCISGVRRTDVLAARRDTFLAKLSTTLVDCAAELLEQGHNQRAIDLLERLPPVSTGKTAARVSELLAKARAAFERLEIGSAADAQPSAGRPLIEFESKYYKISANLEQEAAQRVADLMDDLHAFYVEVYFDGNEKKARGAKATIRIHPDRADMLKSWSGGPPPEGWWSPGENTVHCYDSRTNSTGTGGPGSLDWMLETLFHEASHQFMTLLAQGGFVPAWINEGTASFFEGTVAMADHRVLWPEAARMRLGSLVQQLAQGKPSARDVISYDAPASYPAEYYSFGWGLVYFLQQYEDPQTLDYVFRPFYARYRGEVIKHGGEPLKVFEQVFLGKDSPLGWKSFEDFDRDWSRWIREEVATQNGTDSRARTLRLERMRAELAAAELSAKEGKKARVPEKDLLARALSHAEYVCTAIDRDKPDGDLLVQQAEILERLGRPSAAAPLYQRVLDLADASRVKLDLARYAELEKRLKQLDAKNAALRTARSRTLELGRSAEKLLGDYEKAEPPLVLRAYTFAALASGVLKDDKELAEATVRLRERARAAGRMLGSIRELAGEASAWKNTYWGAEDSTPQHRFQVAQGSVDLVTTRMLGYINASLEAHGEYEVRGKLARTGKIELGSACGLTIAGREGADWFLAGIDDKGQAGLWSVRITRNSPSTPKRIAFLRLEKPVEPGESPELAAHVYADGKVELKVGERATVIGSIPLDGAIPRYAGIFVKNGAASVSDLLLELYP